MSDDASIREYLMPAPDSFWEWRDGGEVVTWKNGRTIAFRDELRTVISWLAPHGLPSLDSICLLLAATHDAWSSTGAEAHGLANVLDQRLAAPQPILRDMLLGLNQVHELESSLRTPVRSKSVLAEVVLSGCRKLAKPDLATSIVDAMRRGLGDQLLPPDAEVDSRGYGPLLLLRDMADMLPQLQQIDAERLRLRLATGLESLPDQATIELSPSEMARALLDSLLDDAEFAGLSRVAKELLAVASLPRRLDVESEFHTGGVSDISNRGSMERLLISELANDDLTLAVRVAMNEALYLRREVPPSTPLHHRTVLIDAGIRSWGVPRVFATAVALAFMAGTAKGGSYSCFRAKRDSVERADLATRHGLVEHLRALEADLHLAAAIPAYLREIEANAEPIEAILLMSEDALLDEDVQQALRRVELPQLFVATVNRDGDFRLSERGRHGMKPLREAKIDIDDLFRERTGIVAPAAAHDLPAIFFREPFPLLLGAGVDFDQAFYVCDWGVLSITGDGRLLRWHELNRGPRQISDSVVGKILWVAPAAVDGTVSLVVGGSSNASLMHVNNQNIVVDSVHLRPSRDGEKYVARHGVLYLITPSIVEVLYMRTGLPVERLQPPDGALWVRDRFFRSPSSSVWYALSHDGHSARFEKVEIAGEQRLLPPLITMFDQVGTDGPVGVTQKGDLISTATGKYRRVGHNLAGQLIVRWISPDGLRLHLANVKSQSPIQSGVVVDTTNLSCRATRSTLLDDRAQPLVRPISLRHRFQAIGLDSTGNLALQSWKRQLLVIELQQGRPAFIARAGCEELRARQDFKLRIDKDYRFKLWQATWPNGSRAMLDSRGLLHLNSADQSVPATTLILAEGELTVWSSDGRTWGKAYFIGDAEAREQSASTQRLLFNETVFRFVERLDA